MTVANWLSGKYESNTSAPVASALVMSPGTHVRRMRHAGVGTRSASEMDSMALTVRAVPRMTVESSFTGTITMPSPAAAR